MIGKNMKRTLFISLIFFVAGCGKATRREHRQAEARKADQDKGLIVQDRVVEKGGTAKRSQSMSLDAEPLPVKASYWTQTLYELQRLGANNVLHLHKSDRRGMFVAIC